MDISILLAWAGIGLSLVLIAATTVENLWPWRRYAAKIVYATLIVSGLFVVGGIPKFGYLLPVFYALAAGTVSFFAARLHKGRLEESDLRDSTKRSSAAMFLVFFALLGLQFFSLPRIITTEAIIGGAAVAALVLACMFALQTIWALTHYSNRLKHPQALSAHPPTVTLAIPARNETHALSHCLNAALSSTYPRLEILVLDDCSQDKTSQLIRSFAHGGVRFVQGKEPASGWLGKNNALATLEKEASGEYIFFSGVDTNLKPQTVTNLVTYTENNSLDMVSVLPHQKGQYLFPVLFQHLRYVWQIILPPRKRGHQPVSSQSWLVKRSSLHQAGGMETIKNEVVPEAWLAQHFARQNRYRFVVADTSMPISYGKRWSSQFDTSTRLWYPALGKRPFVALGVAFALLLFGVGPFIGLFAGSLFTQLTCAVICLLYVLTYGAILHRLQPGTWWLSVWLLPLVLAQEAILVLVSAVKYEFLSVDWKGRNICYPVLHKNH